MEVVMLTHKNKNNLKNPESTAVGVVGAGYCFIVSAVALNKGPKCLITDSVNVSKWTYPFEDGNYLSDHNLWSLCTSPEDVVPWNLTLFSLLLIMSGIQMVLCAIQAINGLMGTICGDCKEMAQCKAYSESAEITP
ncbi:hypothetical protein JD844_007396 [Phrynosoma platyrhinos]|uniref:Uncharacterized protein n=1 Tax=Phrynosoma platyrhinos TaxID=52577 RepID=A0ABQ7T3E5_PHRPL|nr:hypothetical protein JD844_007396 [Phrynosoma platyrhinos]